MCRYESGMKCLWKTGDFAFGVNIHSFGYFNSTTSCVLSIEFNRTDATGGQWIQFFEITEEKEKLINFVIKKVSKLIERKRNQSKKINILIDEQMLPLGGFVQDIIRNSVLAMVSSLKGAKIKGEEMVSIFIKRLDNQK